MKYKKLKGNNHGKNSSVYIVEAQQTEKLKD